MVEVEVACGGGWPEMAVAVLCAVVVRQEMAATTTYFPFLRSSVSCFIFGGYFSEMGLYIDEGIGDGNVERDDD
ncbi:hypothetical protein A2U01_0041451 [Trifolium medium]|uniref:Uncharacterized protein n=1 Tax=Trifolium medium TaxID=97028 RepID=A0A392Q8V5_9FABA|nr:hypothetical protein [Trifolium medium]